MPFYIKSIRIFEILVLNYLNNEFSYLAAIFNNSLYYNSSVNRYKSEIGSFKITGIDIYDKSLPTDSFKIYQIFIFILRFSLSNCHHQRN